ncbi:MAG: transglycosylase domain-containing protein [Eggerthellaceae bacterium]|nr:transglycosylase domain-containing protein [Eggerthellaceae bacterium]
MKNRRKQRQKKSHGVSWALIISFIAVIVIAYGTVQGVIGIVNSWLEDLPSVEDSDAFSYARKTRIYAKDTTTLLAELYLENREPISIDQAGFYVLRGTVDVEDERFYEHNGVDPMGIARALYVNLTGGAIEGASTITQQFVRATLMTPEEANEISVKRKVREAQLAMNLEQIYTKDEILMMYLNTINYGDGCWGIEAAARNYFQKSSKDLSLTEAAALVGIPQSPNYLNPKENPSACLDRRNHVLSRMLVNGDISQEEYDEAVQQPLGLNPAPDTSSDGILLYPYFTSYVRDLLLQNFSRTEVFKGGMTVYTTIDPYFQYLAEWAAEEQYAVMASDLEVSLVAFDPNTGYILAMVGGRDFYEDQFNLATQAQRHAGSSFKTFTLTAAIESGISPETKIDTSSPVTFRGWRVENYGGWSGGIMTIREATAISSNTAYARLVQEVTSNKVYEMARRLGIMSKDSEAVSPDESFVADAITLGAYGVNTLEMANAYATLATGGIHRDPVAITLITDRLGNTLFEHVDNPHQAISPQVAYAVTRVLQTVFTSGTAGGYGLSSGQPCAGKTGTSEAWRDSWLVGYTPQLSCAVWIGARQERTMPQSLNCTRVWNNFMTWAMYEYDITGFSTASAPAYNNPFNEKQKELYDKKDPSTAPNVVGKTLSQAAIELEGFEAEWFDEFSEIIPAGVVIRQVPHGEKLWLYVSKGPDPNAKPPDPNLAPNVVGMTVAAATIALAGYMVERVDDYSATVAVGIVISQEVVAGKVRLHVSKGPDPTPPVVTPPGGTEPPGGGTEPPGGGTEPPGGGTEPPGGGTGSGDGTGTGTGTGTGP